MELIDNADLAVFSHCGHWSMIERTADFNRLVRDFFLELSNGNRGYAQRRTKTKANAGGSRSLADRDPELLGASTR